MKLVLKFSQTLFNCQFRRCSSISEFASRLDQTQLKSLLKNSATFDELKDPIDPDNNWSTLPYTKETSIDRELVREKCDPETTSVILFPGQGSQYVGMSKDLMKFPAVKDLFEIANEVLGYDLRKLCLEGPACKLNDTIHAQPAIVVSSLAAVEKLKEERPFAIEKCTTTAGFSVGEITSLIFSGAIPYDKGIELIKIRAKAMQTAAQIAKGGMATIFYGADGQVFKACEAAKNWCIERGIEEPECKIASYLNAGSKVVSGNIEAIDFLANNLKQFRLKRLMRLKNVSGAFHSSLMIPAADVLREAIRYLDVEKPLIHCYSNVTGKQYHSAVEIKKLLPKQIIKAVKWEQTMQSIYKRTDEEFPRTFICGPTSSLANTLQICNGKAWNKCSSIIA